MIYDRKSGKVVQEHVYGNHAMRFLYNTTFGGICVAFLRLPILSRMYGAFQKGKRSKKNIEKLAKNYNMGEFQDKYKSFNDFITRKEPREVEYDANVLIAPADSCLLVKTLDSGVIFSAKGKDYTLSHFLKNEESAKEYEGGICLIFRLRVYDYHRFCFVDDGVIQSRKRVIGFLDSINTNATGKFTLSSNYREIFLLKTENFGDIIFAEIGAMLVGRIVQTNNSESFCKGSEKGYFEFGGSSIVILLKKDIAEIDNDILAYSAKGIETIVKYGERIGIKHV